jgi:hypothetical protein
VCTSVCAGFRHHISWTSAWVCVKLIASLKWFHYYEIDLLIFWFHVGDNTKMATSSSSVVRAIGYNFVQCFIIEKYWPVDMRNHNMATEFSDVFYSDSYWISSTKHFRFGLEVNQRHVYIYFLKHACVLKTTHWQLPFLATISTVSIHCQFLCDITTEGHFSIEVLMYMQAMNFKWSEYVAWNNNYYYYLFIYFNRCTSQQKSTL